MRHDGGRRGARPRGRHARDRRGYSGNLERVAVLKRFEKGGEAGGHLGDDRRDRDVDRDVAAPATLPVRSHRLRGRGRGRRTHRGEFRVDSGERLRAEPVPIFRLVGIEPGTGPGRDVTGDRRGTSVPVTDWRIVAERGRWRTGRRDADRGAHRRDRVHDQLQPVTVDRRLHLAGRERQVNPDPLEVRARVRELLLRVGELLVEELVERVGLRVEVRAHLPEQLVNRGIGDRLRAGERVAHRRDHFGLHLVGGLLRPGEVEERLRGHALFARRLEFVQPVTARERFVGERGLLRLIVRGH